jgi:hypothetical protein
MTRKYKTVKGGEHEIRAYIKRSNQLWRHALNAYQEKDRDAFAIMAIHASISLSDAACIVHQGTRYAGTSHDEAVQYFYDLGIEDEGFKKACRRLGQIISEKSIAEYGGANLDAKTAESIRLNSERFRDYLFETLLKKYFS